eukprot:2937435-Pyramimonas_sp.AAC.1
MLAPKPAAPIMTVTDPDTGLPCFDAEDDQRVRTRSICEVCGGQAMELDDRPIQAGKTYARRRQDWQLRHGGGEGEHHGVAQFEGGTRA